MAILGLDAGGTKILVGIVDDDGKILYSQKYPMHRGEQEKAIGTIFGALDDFVESTKGMDLPKPEGIGMGTTGLIDFENGILVSCIGTPVHTPVPVREIIGSKYHLPVLIDNDVHCATIGEGIFGEGRDAKSMFYINVGTGLAAGIFEEGRLLRGAINATGETGYINMNVEHSIPFNPGIASFGDAPQDIADSGLVEFVASGGSLIMSAEANLPKYPNSALHKHKAEGQLHAGTIFEEAQKGDELASKLANRAILYLGNYIGGLMGLLNPDKIVFGGGVMKNEWFLENVKATTKATCAVPMSWDCLKYFGVSRLDAGNVGLIGAAALFKASPEIAAKQHF